MIFKKRNGIALLTVIVFFLIGSMFVFISLFLLESQTKLNVRYQNNESALHYAEAGLNQYIWHLNKLGSTIPTGVVDFEDGQYVVEPIDVKDSYQIIKITGWSNKDSENKRTIESKIGKRTFAQYVYFSQEDSDTIRWTTNDKNYGPYHTNKNITVDGNPTFYGRVTYNGRLHFYNGQYRGGISDPNFKPTSSINGSYPKFESGIQWVQALEVPATNSDLEYRAKNGGYFYEGRTSIRLNSNGTITIRNEKVNSGNSVNRHLPSNGVIYIKGSSVNESDKFNTNSGNAFISGTLKGKLTIGASNDIYITGYDPTDFSDSPSLLGGIKYASTTFKEKRNSANIIIGYEASGEDMLGLVANDDVWILCKDWFRSNGNGGTVKPNVSLENINIDSAVFAINGSFGFEKYYPNSSTYWDYYYHNNKKITLRGAIIQKTRGAVGQGTDYGYDTKDYAHDNRMEYQSPPYFTSPENSGWEIKEWKEVNDHVSIP
ncbi:hypothetical protein [Acetoanaerobium noterae]|uniref:hypothetical protein n=1 Tax=Acetoanaerobium noterae TaxID=745369 RepID=UPI0028A6D7B6|nr:hypothetical protein [Acetoanaerobium noterae]